MFAIESGFMRWTSRVLLVLMTCMALPSTASAGMVDTAMVAGQTAAERSRAKLASWISREEVRARLAAHGISQQKAEARVAALSDEEAEQLAAEFDRLPAGGDVVGTVVFVFVLLLVTDILGFTKIFPFTRSIR